MRKKKVLFFLLGLNEMPEFFKQPLIPILFVVGPVLKHANLKHTSKQNNPCPQIIHLNKCWK